MPLRIAEKPAESHHATYLDKTCQQSTNVAQGRILILNVFSILAKSCKKNVYIKAESDTFRLSPKKRCEKRREIK